MMTAIAERFIAWGRDAGKVKKKTPTARRVCRPDAVGAFRPEGSG